MYLIDCSVFLVLIFHFVQSVIAIRLDLGFTFTYGVGGSGGVLKLETFI